MVHLTYRKEIIEYDGRFSFVDIYVARFYISYIDILDIWFIWVCEWDGWGQ